MNRETDASDIEGVERLLVDGDNLLHAARGGRDESAVAWLLPRLEAWRPEGVRIVVALDGHPAPGEAVRGRVTKGIEFRHAGSRSADDLLVQLLAAAPYAQRARTVVVTRDRDLQARARKAGGLTRSADWLLRSLGSGGAGRRREGGGGTVHIGRGRPRASQRPRPSADARTGADGERGADAARGADAEPDERAWRPGRGATRKRGNPRRSARGTRRR